MGTHSPFPDQGSCLEATQVYRRLAGGATTGKYFGVWDHCQSGNPGAFLVFEPQDPNWQNRYVRTYQGKPTYSVSITTINSGSTMGQCWYANIYDYILGGWVQKLSRCGIPVHNWAYVGWTMWESWYLTNSTICPTLPSIRSLDIVLYDPYTASPTPFTNWPSDIGPNGPKENMLGEWYLHIQFTCTGSSRQYLAREYSEPMGRKASC